MQLERGFSVIELLVALCLTAVLLTGTFTVLERTRVSYEATTSAAEWFETAQRALDRLSSDARSAGFSGCYRSDSNLSAIDLAPIQTFSGSSSNAAHLVLRTPAPDSDVLVLHVPRRNSVPLAIASSVHSSTSGSIEIDLARTRTLSVGDAVMLYNCKRRAFTHITGMQGSHIQYEDLVFDAAVSLSNPEDAWFRPGDELIVLDEIVYYIGRIDNESTSALWRADGKHEIPLLKDVARFFVSPDANRSERIQAAEKADWSVAREAHITLVLTERQTSTRIQTPGRSRTLTATICIRNRCLPG